MSTTPIFPDNAFRAALDVLGNVEGARSPRYRSESELGTSKTPVKPVVVHYVYVTPDSVRHIAATHVHMTDGRLELYDNSKRVAVFNQWAYFTVESENGSGKSK